MNTHTVQRAEQPDLLHAMRENRRHSIPSHNSVTN